VGPRGSHYIIGPLQKASGPRKKEKTAMSHFWDTHHSSKIVAPVPFLYMSRRDTGWGVVPERGKIASLGIHGASYCGDKLTMAQDGGRVHGDNPPHA